MGNFNIKENNYYSETFENGVLTETETGNKDYQFKTNSISSDTLRFFRRLGGEETVKQGTKFGLGCTVSTSISPDKSTKVVRYFFY